MARLADILKGSGPGPVAPGAAGAASRRLADVVRQAAEPAAQAPVPRDSSEDGAGSVRRAPSIPPGGGTEAPLLRELEAATQVLQQAVAGVEELLQAVARDAPVSIARAEDAAELLVQSLQRGDTLLLPFFTVGAASTSPARKAVNVCILSVKMGMELGYVLAELQRLGVAALLYDAGMANQLSPEPGPRRWVAERRSRKPADLRRPGDRLDEYAAIIRLADTYESLVHSRPFRHPIGPLEALGEILRRERTSFPDAILKALIRALSAFPVGSLVRLNTGEIGRVVARNRDFPLRPVVEVLVRGERWLETPVVIDLSQNPLQHIQDSVAEEALP